MMTGWVKKFEVKKYSNFNNVDSSRVLKKAGSKVDGQPTSECTMRRKYLNYHSVDVLFITLEKPFSYENRLSAKVNT